MTTWSIVASVILLTGCWLVGSRSRWGFICTIAGEVVWVVIAVNREMYDLAVLCLVFAALAFANFRHWSKGES